ncbi:MAG TPA: hypothetical protein VFV08_11585, partial [Puia sp.]|nr:hypothetical protein [Puia sp.]
MKVNEKQYTIYYTKMDQPDLRDYKNLFSSSYLSIEKFFDQSIAKPFDIFIHPNRKSLDSSWQVQWNLPDFKSECWMVASGV